MPGWAIAQIGVHHHDECKPFVCVQFRTIRNGERVRFKSPNGRSQIDLVFWPESGHCFKIGHSYPKDLIMAGCATREEKAYRAAADYVPGFDLGQHGNWAHQGPGGPREV